MPLFALIARRAMLPCAAALLLAPLPAAAQCLLCSDSGTASDAIATAQPRDLPLNVDIVADLDFSRLVAGQGGGSVTLDPQGGPSVARGNVAPIGGYGFSGRVIVTGTPGRGVRIDIPQDVILTSSTGRTARVSGIVTGLPPVVRLGPDGRLEFGFGGQLEIDGEADGDYRGRIPVTVSYE
jgi:Domain of unknown function (DUF4402)